MNFLPGPMELVLILIIVAMLFGVGKLPEVFGAVGKGIKEFRKEAESEIAPSKTVAPVADAPVMPAAPAAPIAATVVPSTDGINSTVKSPQ